MYASAYSLPVKRLYTPRFNLELVFSRREGWMIYYGLPGRARHLVGASVLLHSRTCRKGQDRDPVKTYVKVYTLSTVLG